MIEWVKLTRNDIQVVREPAVTDEDEWVTNDAPMGRYDACMIE